VVRRFLPLVVLISNESKVIMFRSGAGISYRTPVEQGNGPFQPWWSALLFVNG